MLNNPKLVAAQKQSAVDRLFGKEAAAAVPLPEEEPVDKEETDKEDEENPLVRKSYSILRGWRRPLSMLRLMNRQGEVALVDYGSMTWINLRPTGELVLRVNDGEAYTITLSGRGLAGELLDGLQRGRVEWIKELDELVAAAAARDDPAEPVVTGIHIKEGSVSREWSRGRPARAGASQPLTSYARARRAATHGRGGRRLASSGRRHILLDSRLGMRCCRAWCNLSEQAHPVYYVYDYGQEYIWVRSPRHYPRAERLLKVAGCLFYGFVYYLIFTK